MNVTVSPHPCVIITGKDAIMLYTDFSTRRELVNLNALNLKE